MKYIFDIDLDDDGRWRATMKSPWPGGCTADTLQDLVYEIADGVLRAHNYYMSVDAYNLADLVDQHPDTDDKDSKQ